MSDRILLVTSNATDALTVRERRPNRTNPTGRINGWKAILNTLAIAYGDRLIPS